MPEFATAPNSCELNKQLNRGWAGQVKPKGTGPENWVFLRGATSIAPVVTKSGQDATDLDSNGWESTLDTSRKLEITIEHQYVRQGTLDLLTPDQELLRFTGEELGAEGQLDVRVWRTDTDEGWEATVNNNYAPGSGDANGIRTGTATLTASCEPTRIHSVLKGEEKKDSVPMEASEIRKRFAASSSGRGGDEVVSTG